MHGLCRRGIRIFSAVVLLVGWASGCRIGSDSGDTPPPTVYTAGDYFDGSNVRACYWIGPNSAPITVGSAGQDSWAQALAASGGHIFTAGSYYDGSTDRACYWTGSDPVAATVSSSGINADGYAIAVR